MPGYAWPSESHVAIELGELLSFISLQLGLVLIIVYIIVPFQGAEIGINDEARPLNSNAGVLFIFKLFLLNLIRIVTAGADFDNLLSLLSFRIPVPPNYKYHIAGV